MVACMVRCNEVQFGSFWHILCYLRFCGKIGFSILFYTTDRSF